MFIEFLLVLLLIVVLYSKNNIMHKMGRFSLGKCGLGLLVILLGLFVNVRCSILFALIVILAFSNNLEEFDNKLQINIDFKKSKNTKVKKSKNDQLKVGEQLTKPKSSHSLLVPNHRGNNHTDGTKEVKCPKGCVAAQSKASIKEGFFS